MTNSGNSIWQSVEDSSDVWIVLAVDPVAVDYIILGQQSEQSFLVLTRGANATPYLAELAIKLTRAEGYDVSSDDLYEISNDCDESYKYLFTNSQSSIN